MPTAPGDVAALQRRREQEDLQEVERARELQRQRARQQQQQGMVSSRESTPDQSAPWEVLAPQP